MALNITRTDDYGNEVTYWNIGCIDHDFKGQGITVTLYGYRDQAAKEAGLQPPMADKFQITASDINYTTESSRAAVYAIIKQRPEYAGATDC
jgi:hypothetical protein